LIDDQQIGQESQGQRKAGRNILLLSEMHHFGVRLFHAESTHAISGSLEQSVAEALGDRAAFPTDESVNQALRSLMQNQYAA
jgi:hypothetical protein